ncbi:MAG: hypothetical protein ACRD1H_00695, partial [Vicinamibacterales bacterium]
MLRVKLFEGMGVLAASLSVHNPSRAAHRGGIWELGDPGSILLRDVSVRLTLAEGQPARGVRYSESVGSPWCTISGSVRIYQDSSGGERWNSHTHVTRDGDIGPTFRGYEVTADGLTRRSERATPTVQLQGNDTVSLTMAHFWENFPKAVEADERSITLRLFPGCSRTLHEIQGGERKRHDFTLCLAGDRVTAEPLAWARLPLVVSASPTWYRTCETLPFLIPLDVNSESDALVQTALEGARSFASKRERADEYGWRHFGDLYADHEAVHADGGFVSHYNNQYDPICGFARQFFRTGDTRWYDLRASLARHVADIDIYHTAED